MSSRRIVAVVLLAAVAALAFPAAVEAGIFGDARGELAPPDSGVLARIASWIESVYLHLSQPFMAQEGASITGNG